jgi:uncharacterized protein (TIGR02145 family)
MVKIYSSLILLLFSFAVTAAQDFKGIMIGRSFWMSRNLNSKVNGSESYNGDDKNDAKYGRLYNWESAKTACPSGWHLPTDKEWSELIENLGGVSTAGKVIKTGGSSGFNAQLGGFSSIGRFMMIDDFGTYWTSSEYDGTHAWYVYIRSQADAITKTYFTKSYKLSVRCVKNSMN